jgi:hypothetical protein
MTEPPLLELGALYERSGCSDWIIRRKRLKVSKLQCLAYRKDEISALTEVKIRCGKTECDGHSPNDLHIAAQQHT